MTTNTQTQAAVSKTNSAQTAGDKSREAPKPFDVQHLRGLLEKATPGPWEVWEFGDPRVVAAEAGWTIYTNEASLPDEEPMLWANAALIVDAINALPALLDRIERLEGAMGEIIQADTKTSLHRIGDAYSTQGWEEYTHEGPCAAIARQALSTGETK